MGENQHEHKNVIGAELILDEVTGKKIEPVLWSFEMPDQGVKTKGYEHPQNAPPRGSAHAQFAITMLEGDKVDRKRDKNTDMKGDPHPNTRRHRCEVFMW
jgi:hypothetical protein